MTYPFHRYSGISFLLTGLVILVFTRSAPIADFGNYYYASKLLSEGKFSVEDYKSIHHFNEQIKSYGESNFFENYTPVPPFSLVFYLPFVGLKAATAKFLFNIISLIVFCISLQRLVNRTANQNNLSVFLSLIVVYPLYANLLQGQSYLLICAFLIESYISHTNKNSVMCAFWFSLAFCLKIFTGFLLLYFILKKDVRAIAVGFGWILVLFVTTHFFIDHSIIPYYLSDILPRLAAGEILEPYHYSSQSLHTFLMKLFSYDLVQNPAPLINSTLVIVTVESLFVAFIISGIVAVSKKVSDVLLYSLILFSSLLVTRHSAGYSLLLVAPLCLSTLSEHRVRNVFLLICLCLFAVNIPASLLSAQPVPLQFLRLWFFIAVFILILFSFHTKINYAILLFVFVTGVMLNYFFSTTKTSLYFTFQNSKGALYDYGFSDGKLLLRSCYGAQDITENFLLDGNIKEDTHLSLRENNLYYKEQLISSSPDHKLKPSLLNDTCVLFLSDLNQGVGFYRLRMISLGKN